MLRILGIFFIVLGLISLGVWGVQTIKEKRFVEKKIRPQDKWNAKAGYISKSYKLKKDVVESFAKACEQAQTSQAGQLTKMMQQFIESVSDSDTEKQQ